MRHAATLLIKHQTKLSALLASRQWHVLHLHIARTRPCFNCFKDLLPNTQIRLTCFSLFGIHLYSYFFITIETKLEGFLHKHFSKKFYFFGQINFKLDISYVYNTFSYLTMLYWQYSQHSRHVSSAIMLIIAYFLPLIFSCKILCV